MDFEKVKEYMEENGFVQVVGVFCHSPNKQGIWKVEEIGKGENAKFIHRKIMGKKVRIVSKSKNKTTKNKSYELEFVDNDGEVIRRTLGLEELCSNESIRKALTGCIAIQQKNIPAVIEYFNNLLELVEDDLEQIDLYDGIGLADETRKYHVIHPLLIGEENGRVEVFGGLRDKLKTYQTKGTFPEWVENIYLPYIAKSENLIYGLGHSIASLLVKRTNTLNTLLSFHGGSSTGKTVGLTALQSFWGNAETLDTWNVSDASFISKCCFLNGFPAFFDELKVADEKKVAGKIYIMTSGKEGERNNQDGSTRQIREFSLNGLSTSEQAITNIVTDNGGVARIIELGSGHLLQIGFTHEDMGNLMENTLKYFGTGGVEITRKINNMSNEEFNFYFDEKLNEFKAEFRKIASKTHSNQLGKLILSFALTKAVLYWMNETNFLPIDSKVANKVFMRMLEENCKIEMGKHVLKELLDILMSKGKILYKEAGFDTNKLFQGRKDALVDGNRLFVGRTFFLDNIPNKTQFETLLREMIESGCIVKPNNKTLSQMEGGINYSLYYGKNENGTNRNIQLRAYEISPEFLEEYGWKPAYHSHQSIQNYFNDCDKVMNLHNEFFGGGTEIELEEGIF